MLKLYVKKVLLTGLFPITYLLIGGLLAFVWHLAFRDLFSEQIRDISVAILAILLEIIMLYLMRYNNLDYKSYFIQSYYPDKISFSKDFVTTIKSKENIIHTLAFLTIELLFCLPIGIAENTPFFGLVVGTVYFVLVGGSVFTVGNTVIWCLVHKRWLRRY